MESAPADRLPDIVADALECPPETRTAFLATACAGDKTLLAQAEELIAHAHATQGFLASPAAVFGAGELALEPSGELKPGAVLDDYRVIALLGEGGMGEVYLAEDTRLERKVALKLLKRHLREMFAQRFDHERRVLAGLTHPGIARLYNAAQTDGRAYLVMEYVEGEQIDDYCDRKKLTIDERLPLFRKVCAAVAYAHQHLIIHRDLKPANIRVTPEGEPKLLDFGIAKLVDPLAGEDHGQAVTRLGAMTPGYASPEQLRGETVTTASDIYNLGLLLCELLSGRRRTKIPRQTWERAPGAPPKVTTLRPSTAAANEAVAAARGTIPARLARQLTGDLDNIVLKAMRPEPARRYPSVSQLADDVLRRMERRPVTARKETLRYVGARFIARNKALTAAALVILLTLIGGIVGTSWQAHVANAARRAADQQRQLAQRRFEDVRRLADSLMFEIHDSVQDLAGSTPTRKLIVTRALEYLDSLSREADTPALRRDLAIAYRKVGDVQGNPYLANLGDTEGAMESYRKAEALLAGLGSLRGEVDPVEVQMELGKVYRALGDLLEVKGDIAGMLRSYRQSLGIFEQLNREQPGEAAVLDELARAYQTLGDGLEHGDNAHAEQVHSYEQMLVLDQRALAATPANPRARRSLAIAFLKLGGITLTDPAHGIADLTRSRDILKTLSAENPDSGRARRDYALALYTLGWGLSELDNPGAATPNFEQALKIREQIAAADPQNEQARYDVAVADSNLAEAFTKSGQPENALERARQAVSILEPMMGADPDNTSYMRNCGFFYENVAHAQAALAAHDSPDAGARITHFTEARAFYQKAADSFAKLAAKGATRTEDRDLPAKLAAAIADCDQRLTDLRR